MSEKTGISWTDATFNPWWGCQKVSPACDHCYAERDAHRFAPGRVLWGVGSERRTFGDVHWQAPFKWAKHRFSECMGCGWRGQASDADLRTSVPGFDRDPGAVRCCPACQEPLLKEARRRVFCASMADWLDLDAPISEFVRLLDTIRRTPELDWLLLSKRIGNWRKRLDEAYVVCGTPAMSVWLGRWLDGDAPANVWLGATVVNQEEADRDVPKLLAVPARVRFLSIEPMLGPVDLRELVIRSDPYVTVAIDALGGEVTAVNDHGSGRIDRCDCVDWVIAGGESGPHARPAHPDWFRSLRDQCAAAGVPFHFKQWGEHTPGELSAHPDYENDGTAWRLDQMGRRWHDPMESTRPREEWAPIKFGRPGKAAAGRLLDGVEHNGFPTC